MEEWKEDKLGQYIDVISGVAFKSDEFADTGIPVIKIGNIVAGTIKPTSDDSFLPKKFLDLFKDYVLNEKDVLIAMSGNTTCKIGRLPKSYTPSLLNQRVGLIRPNLVNTSEISIDYIYYLLTSELYQRKLWNYATATGQPNLSPRDIKRIKFIKPSLHEQTVIANLLSKVDEAITSVQNSIDAAERLKKSLMQNLLTGKMKPDGTFRTPDEFYIDEKFGKVPIGWEVKRIKDFGEIQTGKTPPTDEPEVFSDKENGFMFITPGDLDVAKYIEETERYVSEKGIRYSYVLPKGSVCEVCIGSTIGKIGITTAKCCSNQQITSVIVNNEHDAEYLYYAMLSRREHFKSVAGINATPQINKSGYSKYKVLCPQDKLEQIAIAKRISSVDKTINEQEQKIKSLERLKKSLMQNLLTGKVKTNNKTLPL